jgi:hypothetical protein
MASYPYNDYGFGWPRDFPEFGMNTQMGDIAMQRVVQKIRTMIALDQVTREGLDKAILLGIVYVASHPTNAQHEVMVDRSCLILLAREINALDQMRKRGWTVDWKDWRS